MCVRAYLCVRMCVCIFSLHPYTAHYRVQCVLPTENEGSDNGQELTRLEEVEERDEDIKGTENEEI